MPARPLLLGHRGARATRSIPENTIPSFEQALVHGCDGFELDVRLTADGRAVICHDPEVDGKPVAHTTSGELNSLARFEEVLERFSGRAFLDIELKVGGLESTVRDVVRNLEPQHGFVVSSFQPQILRTLRDVDRTLPLGFICDRESDLQRWRELPADFLIPHYALVSARLIEEVHRANRKLFAWTVNDRGAMLRLTDWGADGLISDDTELLVRTLRPTGRS